MIQIKMLVIAVAAAKEFELNLGVRWRDWAAVVFCSGVQEEIKDVLQVFTRATDQSLEKQSISI